ncbi:MAG: DUF4430 domain-containing protein [Halanaerobiales bacterium]
MDKKKILLIVLVIVLAGALLFVYNKFFLPEGVAGEKEVSIRIIIEEEQVDRLFTYKTDHEFLYELLKEKEEELGASFEEFSFGVMLKGLMGYEAEQARNEFFHISINGEDAMEGIQQIPIKDGDTYTFHLMKW